MSSLKPKIDLNSIPTYKGGDSSLDQYTSVVKLSSNENPFGPSENAIDAYNNINSTLNRYPDGNASHLKESISVIYDVDPKRLICGAGSDEILCLACRAYAGIGDEIIHTEHAFSMYSIYAKSVGAKPVSVAEHNITADIDAILNGVTDRTKIVFLANPNNPTGTILNKTKILDLRKNLRQDILLVLDGAYSEFMSTDDHDGALFLSETSRNVLITRTFSKIYGLAALRVGWGYADPSIITLLEKLRNPFNLNSSAIITASAAIRDIEYTNKLRRYNSDIMREFIAKFRSIGLGVVGDSGNFILTKFPDKKDRSAEKADLFLRKSGIIVRRVESYGLSNYLRVTVGKKAEMDIVFEELKKFLEGKDGKN